MFDKNFIVLLNLFHRHPNLFLSILHKNKAFTEEFKTKLAKTSIKEKPYFTDMDKMIEYYVSLIADETAAEDKEKMWNDKLNQALVEQKYEDAAIIRDYMKKKKYKIRTQF